MTAWVDFFVYVTLIVVFWGCMPAWSRVTLPMVADRNPEWFAGHPEVERRLADNRWFRVSCRLWGGLSLAALVALQVGGWPRWLAGDGPRWEALKDLNSTLLIAGLIAVAICMGLFQRWLHANVPLAARRQASLVRRSADDYVPPTLQYAIYGAVVLHLAVWLAVGITGRYTTDDFWGMLAFQFAIAGVVLVIALVAVRRRPGPMDRIGSMDYRRLEVRVAFATQLLPLMNGVARLYEQMGYATTDTLDRALHLGLVAFVAMQAIAITFWLRPAPDGRPGPSSSSVRSLGAF